MRKYQKENNSRVNMYVVIYIVTVYNSNDVMVDVNLYVTRVIAKGR